MKIEGSLEVAGKTELAMVEPGSRVLSEHVANQLREAIVSDQLKAGQRIVEGEIAAAMKTSHGPVRDALLILENEGLVVRYPHRGTYVAELSLKDAEEIYSLRMAIESLAVTYALRRATPADLDELDALVQRMADKVAEGYNAGEATELDMTFHRTLCQISGHGRALAAWEALSAQTRILLLSRFKKRPGDFQASAVEWHRRLVDVLRRGDLAQAQSELRTHGRATLDSFADDEEQQIVKSSRL